MIKIICAGLILSLLILETHSVAAYKKITLTDPSAICLDGTPGAYYVHEGFQRNKWLINFEDGGWCGSSKSLSDTIEDCYARSLTDLGSSSKYAATWSQTDGILSDSYSNSYREYSIAHFKYCTGTGHQGYRQLPISYKGKNLYFKGHNVTIAQLESLNSLYKIFTFATNIVVTGQSAGALAVFHWVNYIKDRASLLAKVTALPDSGIFLNSYNFNTKRREYAVYMQSFMAISNEQINPPNAECVLANPKQQWKCMFAQYSSQHIKVPIFAIQSPYDSWAIKNILGIWCESSGSLAGCSPQELKYIEEYHTNSSIVLKSIAAKSKLNGYWAPSCSNHIFSTWNALYDSAYRIPGGSANTLMIGISQWDQWLPKSYEHMDSGNWPINKPCSGVKSILSLP